jgi:anthranilate/para-aminobenzoate synthase component I
MRGYLADFTPAREYEKCLNKARAVLRAFELAEKGL